MKSTILLPPPTLNGILFFLFSHLFLPTHLFAQVPSPCSELFFSELIYSPNISNQGELGWTYAQAIEVYNPTHDEISLEGYKVIVERIDFSVSEIHLSGSIESGQAFVIASQDSDDETKAIAGLVAPEFSLDFATNIKLSYGDILIDQFGHSAPCTPLDQIDINNRDAAYWNTIRIGIYQFPGVNILRSELVKFGTATEFNSSELFDTWFLKLENFPSLGLHDCSCLNWTLGFYENDPHFPDRDYFEVLESEIHFIRPKISGPGSIPDDLHYFTELLLSSQLAMIPSVSGFGRVSESDLVYKWSWTMPPGSTGQDIDAIQHVICESPPLNEGIEVGGFVLEINPGIPHTFPISVSSSKSRMLFTVNDCIAASADLVVVDNRTSVFPSLIQKLDNQTVTISTEEGILIESIQIMNSLSINRSEVISNLITDMYKVDLTNQPTGLLLIAIKTNKGTTIKKVMKL